VGATGIGGGGEGGGGGEEEEEEEEEVEEEGRILKHSVETREGTSKTKQLSEHTKMNTARATE
jgi:hypothetical protein